MSRYLKIWLKRFTQRYWLGKNDGKEILYWQGKINPDIITVNNCSNFTSHILQKSCNVYCPLLGKILINLRNK